MIIYRARGSLRFILIPGQHKAFVMRGTRRPVRRTIADAIGPDYSIHAPVAAFGVQFLEAMKAKGWLRGTVT